MKGLTENALTCRSTGGVPCLGYDINKDTLKYEINSFEAEAVKLIFKMYLEGEGYTSIINELNRRGFKTKKGNSFGKNSLYDILRNERYCGVYVYNKCVHPDESEKFNRHATKSDDDIIRIEGGIPQIISKEDFLKVQQKMNDRKQKTATFKAKQDYLLSGKVVCGECNSTHAGNSRKTRDKFYVSYSCTKKNGKAKCDNTGISRDMLEQIILERLSEKVFNKDILPTIIERYNDFALSKNSEFLLMKKELEAKIAETDRGINNIVNLVVSTGSIALTDKLKELETTKSQLQESLIEAERKISEMSIDADKLKSAFNKAKRMLKSGTLKNRKAIVQQYVKEVVIFKDKIIVEYNISGTYTVKEKIQRKK